MSKNNDILKFMAQHTKGARSKKDIQKMLVPVQIEQFTKDVKFTGEIILDIFEYNGETYYKDNFDNILNNEAQVIGIVDSSDKHNIIYHFIKEDDVKDEYEEYNKIKNLNL